MNRIDEIFAGLRSENRRALMPFVCGGHPSLDATAGMIEAAERAGASVVEVGIPYSDPIADGPVIASAMHEALTAGVTVEALFDRVKAVRERVSLGLVSMVSVSIIGGVGGPGRYCEMAKDAGFDGLIVPDSPWEESKAIHDACEANGLALSLLIAPTTPRERALEIAKRCTGFVYLIARSGITGEQTEAPEIAARVAALREVTELPIACGFGIATPEHVRSVVEHADAAIVGSALVRRVSGSEDPARDAESFLRELAGGLSVPSGA
jgi:tryptophan synthase alpha chain